MTDRLGHLRKMLPALLALWLGTAGCLRASDGAVVAKIGTTEVKLDELRAALDGLNAKEKSALEKDPSLLKQTVRALLLQRLVLNQALAKQWDQRPEVMAALARARDAALLESYLQAISRPPDSYPSDGEVLSAYDAHQAELAVPRRFELAQVFIAAPKDADAGTTAKAKTRLDSVLKSLREPPGDFAATARAMSDEKESAERGGEIGWVAESQIDPTIRSAVQGLAKGAVADPIRLDDGWHVLKVLDRKEAATPTLDEIRPRLVEELRAAKARENRQAYLAKAAQENPIALDEIALSKAIPPAGTKEKP